jgi:hypothetical protein
MTRNRWLLLALVLSFGAQIAMVALRGLGFDEAGNVLLIASGIVTVGVVAALLLGET